MSWPWALVVRKPKDLSVQLEVFRDGALGRDVVGFSQAGSSGMPSLPVNETAPMSWRQVLVVGGGGIGPGGVLGCHLAVWVWVVAKWVTSAHLDVWSSGSFVPLHPGLPVPLPAVILSLLPPSDVSGRPVPGRSAVALARYRMPVCLRSRGGRRLRATSKVLVDEKELRRAAAGEFNHGLRRAIEGYRRAMVDLAVRFSRAQLVVDELATEVGDDHGGG